MESRAEKPHRSPLPKPHATVPRRGRAVVVLLAIALLLPAAILWRSRNAAPTTAPNGAPSHVVPAASRSAFEPSTKDPASPRAIDLGRRLARVLQSRLEAAHPEAAAIPAGDDAATTGLPTGEAIPPGANHFQAAFQNLERTRMAEPPSPPDLELAEGLLSAIDRESDPMIRFGLINAYLDAIAGIRDPEQQKAAQARLLTVGAARDALYASMNDNKGDPS